MIRLFRFASLLWDMRFGDDPFVAWSDEPVAFWVAAAWSASRSRGA